MLFHSGLSKGYWLEAFADASRPTAFPSPTVPTQVSLPAAPSLWVPPSPAAGAVLMPPQQPIHRPGTGPDTLFSSASLPSLISSSDSVRPARSTPPTAEPAE